MTILSARRATERDVEAIAGLCSAATGNRDTLWSLRKQAFNPAAWVAARAPVVVVTEGPSVVGFAATLTEGVPLGAAKCAEVVSYVSATHRRRGGARAALSELTTVARLLGLWKFIGYALSEDVAARKLLDRANFREVGVLVKHVQLSSGWHDVTLYERLVLASRKSLPSVHDV